MNEAKQQVEEQSERPPDGVFARVPRNYKDLPREQQDEWARNFARQLITKFKERQEAREGQQRAQADAADSPEAPTSDND